MEVGQKVVSLTENKWIKKGDFGIIVKADNVYNNILVCWNTPSELNGMNTWWGPKSDVKLCGVPEHYLKKSPTLNKTNRMNKNKVCRFYL